MAVRFLFVIIILLLLFCGYHQCFLRFPWSWHPSVRRYAPGRTLPSVGVVSQHASSCGVQNLLVTPSKAQLTKDLIVGILKHQNISVDPRADQVSTSLPVCFPKAFSSFVGRANFLEKTEKHLWSERKMKNLRPLPTILASGGMGKSRAIDELHDWYARNFDDKLTVVCSISYNSIAFGALNSLEINSNRFSVATRMLWSYFVSRADGYKISNETPQHFNDFQRTLHTLFGPEQWDNLRVIVDLILADVSERLNVDRRKLKFVLAIDELQKSGMADHIIRDVSDKLLEPDKNFGFLITLLTDGALKPVRSSGRSVLFVDLPAINMSDTYTLFDESNVLADLPLGGERSESRLITLKRDLQSYFYFQSGGHPRTLEGVINVLKNFGVDYPGKVIVLPLLSDRSAQSSFEISAARIMDRVAEKLPYQLRWDLIQELLRCRQDVSWKDISPELQEAVEQGSVMLSSNEVVPNVSPLVLRENIHKLKNNKGRLVTMLNDIIDTVGFYSVIESDSPKQSKIFERVMANTIAVRTSLRPNAWKDCFTLSDWFGEAQYNPSSSPVPYTVVYPRPVDYETLRCRFRHDFPNAAELSAKLSPESLMQRGSVLVPSQSNQSGYDMMTVFDTGFGKPVVVLFKCKISKHHLMTETAIRDKLKLCSALDWRSFGIEDFDNQVILVFASWELGPANIDPLNLPKNVVLMNQSDLEIFAGPILSHLCRGALWIDSMLLSQTSSKVS
jgi:hypothetical protein